MRQIILDTETTGLNANDGDRIVEIGCIELVNRRFTGRNLHHYVNPQRASDPEALRVHGLTEAFLADKPVFADIAEELMAYLDGAEILIHNASFDVGFLDAEFKRIGAPPTARQVAGIVDTLTMARELFPGKSNTLDALCKRLEVDNTNRTLHGALLDAGLLAEVYIRMTRGQDSLVIDSSGDTTAQQDLQDISLEIDLASFTLPVLTADEAEGLAHDAVLAELDKASGNKTLWRNLVAQ